ncbi:CopG family transcriptional regulator [Tsukamurella soli]|uniref:Ribbon-helix-helix protein, copG family n=1 Tax=Tsukamurella soli TaxID=644556 RepID=A0ABP8JN07_9ACTN
MTSGIDTTRRLGRGRSPARTVRLPDAIDHRLAEYADDAGTTPSDILRRAVVEYMNRHPIDV